MLHTLGNFKCIEENLGKNRGNLFLKFYRMLVHIVNCKISEYEKFTVLVGGQISEYLIFQLISLLLIDKNFY